jgi:hypothetical protein
MSKANDARATGRPTEGEISARAFELYLQRGSVPGYELDDWLQAEAELVSQAVAASGGNKTSSDDATQPAVRRRNGRREAVPPVPPSRRV